MKNTLLKSTTAIALLAATSAAPVAAEVKNADANGFVIIHNAEVAASPDVIWKRLIAPKDWWQKEHSWSGSSERFYIDAQAGGCFCELFQEKQADGKIKTVGSVEHMRVIFTQPGKVLRMQGALGPLQSEAVTGTFTVALAPRKDGEATKLSFSYVVGGYMRYKVADIAPAVDKVLGEQIASLIAPFKTEDAIADKPSNWTLDIEGLTGDETDAPEKPVDTAPDASPAPATKPPEKTPAKPSVKPPVKPPVTPVPKPKTPATTRPPVPVPSVKKER
jgi:hypothetical protein